MLDNYNERLFKGKSLRSKLHIARYTWLKNKIKQYKCQTDKVLELGCFDGKALEYIENSPSQYDGYDANWEGGLDIAKKKWAQFPNYNFKLCTKAIDFQPEINHFDISISQETMEHLLIADLDIYLERLANATKTYSFISVPNEKGIVFLAKNIGKKLTQKNTDLEHFTVAELFYATLGITKKVKRHETGHKGFDYSNLKKDILKYFDIVEMVGLPFVNLPVSLNFTVAFLCKKKQID